MSKLWLNNDLTDRLAMLQKSEADEKGRTEIHPRRAFLTA